MYAVRAPCTRTSTIISCVIAIDYSLMSSSTTGGRPKGSKNKPGHVAGGARVGAGRSKKSIVGGSGPSTDDDSTHSAQPSAKRPRISAQGK